MQSSILQEENGGEGHEDGGQGSGDERTVSGADRDGDWGSRVGGEVALDLTIRDLSHVSAMSL